MHTTSPTTKLVTGVFLTLATLTYCPAQPLKECNIGSPLPATTVIYGPDSITVTAGGSDISGTADQFNFLYQEMTGDFDVRVRVARLDFIGNDYSKAGLMVRDNLTPGSRNYNVVVTPSGGKDWFRVRVRDAQGGLSGTWENQASAAVLYPNGWLRLKRAGNQFTAYRGLDGVNWVLIGQSTPTTAYPDTVFVGLCTTAAQANGGNLTGATTAVYTLQPAPPLPSRQVCSPLNGHLYEFVLAPGTTWDFAQADAESRGMNAHLATITSLEEDLFLHISRLERFPEESALKLNDREFWVGGFQIPVQYPDQHSTKDDWFWLNDEGPISGVNNGSTYANWKTWTQLEPNDSPTLYVEDNQENFLAIGRNDGFGWNDEGILANIAGYVIEYEDTTPPVITSVEASPNVLWPVSHKMAHITLTVSAADNCGPTVCKIVSISCNEPAIAPGSGQSSSDWQITGDLTVNLRAERAGSGNDRIYTITVACADMSGNTSTATVTVTVPHDQGKKK